MSLSDIKQIVSAVAVILTFVAYIPYYRDIIRGKTHPHIYSWALWGILTVLIIAQQIKGGAGSASFVAAAAGFLCLGVIILGFRHSKHDITRSDTLVAILALIAITFWLIAKQPIISVILTVIADLLAFVPTIRKSWYKPHSETLSLYITNTLRFALALFAVQKYTILSSLWLAVWAVANGLFAIMLVIRRRASTDLMR